MAVQLLIDLDPGLGRVSSSLWHIGINVCFKEKTILNCFAICKGLKSTPFEKEISLFMIFFFLLSSVNLRSCPQDLEAAVASF